MPLLLCRFFTESKSAFVIVAILSALVGIITGNPEYVFIDLVAVGAGTLFLWPRSSKLKSVTDTEKKPSPPASKPMPESPPPIRRKESTSYSELIASCVLLIGFWAALLYFKGPIAKETSRKQTSSAVLPPAQQVPVSSNLNSRSSAPAAAPTPSTSAQGRQSAHVQTTPTVAECLNIPSDQKMQRCLEKAK